MRKRGQDAGERVSERLARGLRENWGSCGERENGRERPNQKSNRDTAERGRGERNSGREGIERELEWKEGEGESWNERRGRRKSRKRAGGRLGEEREPEIERKVERAARVRGRKKEEERMTRVNGLRRREIERGWHERVARGRGRWKDNSEGAAFMR